MINFCIRSGMDIGKHFLTKQTLEKNIQTYMTEIF
jgi:hypothetical protein